MPIVRPSTEPDAEAITTMIRRSITELCTKDHHGQEATLSLWLYNKTPDEITAWIKREDNYAVSAVSPSEAVVGFGLMNRAGEILLCYVAPEAIGQGYGRILLQALEQQAQSWKLKTINLESTLTAKGFYEYHGYQQSGDAVEAFGGMVGYPMSKPING